LNVPDSKLETISRLGSTFLVKRFDREGEKRIHFASAMTLLNKADGTSAQDGAGYLDLVSIIKSNGANPTDDLVELWKTKFSIERRKWHLITKRHPYEPYVSSTTAHRAFGALSVFFLPFSLFLPII